MRMVPLGRHTGSRCVLPAHPEGMTELPQAWESSCQQFASQLILPVRLWPLFGDAMAYHSNSHEALAAISGMICGRSCHTPSGLRVAQAAGFSYAFFSPVFSTKTHPEAEPLGLAGLQAACKALQLPIFALGGVTWENAPQCIAHGAHGVAGISMFSQ